MTVSTRATLDDGRTLVVQFEGRSHGWCCYVPRDTKRPTLRPTPAGAIAEHLGYPSGQLPAWVQTLSDRLEREEREAPRHACLCCGQPTLYRRWHYQICEVCHWEDDDVVNRDGPDAYSGPNRISLNQARANYAHYGTADPGPLV